MRRLFTAVAVSLLMLVAPASAAHASGDNAAVAVNTKDGASIFRLAFSVRQVADSVVDNGNAAVAYASCTDCQTVALAFEVVLVRSDVDVFTPTNVAIAENVDCTACTTYASATQIVLPISGPVVLSSDGRDRLHELFKSLQELGKSDQPLDVDALNTQVQAASAELLDIFMHDLVAVGPDGAVPDTATSTTTTTSTVATDTSETTTSTTTTTTVDRTSTSTTSSSTSTTTTSTTAAP
jgi:putative peptide zinc metalloprotease protein